MKEVTVKWLIPELKLEQSRKFIREVSSQIGSNPIWSEMDCEILLPEAEPEWPKAEKHYNLEEELGAEVEAAGNYKTTNPSAQTNLYTLLKESASNLFQGGLITSQLHSELYQAINRQQEGGYGNTKAVYNQTKDRTIRRKDS